MSRGSTAEWRSGFLETDGEDRHITDYAAMQKRSEIKRAEASERLTTIGEEVDNGGWLNEKGVKHLVANPLLDRDYRETLEELSGKNSFTEGEKLKFKTISEISIKRMEIHALRTGTTEEDWQRIREEFDKAVDGTVHHKYDKFQNNAEAQEATQFKEQDTDPETGQLDHINQIIDKYLGEDYAHKPKWLDPEKDSWWNRPECLGYLRESLEGALNEIEEREDTGWKSAWVRDTLASYHWLGEKNLDAPDDWTKEFHGLTAFDADERETLAEVRGLTETGEDHNLVWHIEQEELLLKSKMELRDNDSRNGLGLAYIADEAMEKLGEAKALAEEVRDQTEERRAMYEECRDTLREAKERSNALNGEISAREEHRRNITLRYGKGETLERSDEWTVNQLDAEIEDRVNEIETLKQGVAEKFQAERDLQEAREEKLEEINRLLRYADWGATVVDQNARPNEYSTLSQQNDGTLEGAADQEETDDPEEEEGKKNRGLLGALRDRLNAGMSRYGRNNDEETG